MAQFDDPTPMPPTHTGLTHDEVAAVLRRAAELDGRRAEPRPTPELVEPSIVEEAAVEAGLARAAVRQALAEVAVSRPVAVPDLVASDRSSTTDLTITRRLPGIASQIRAELENYLRRQLLVEQRTFTDGSRWGQRRDRVAGLRRSLDLAQRIRLQRVERVDLRVVPDPAVEGGKGAIVRLDLDLGGVRQARNQLLATGIVGGAAVGVIIVGATGVEGLLLGGPAAVALGVAGHQGGQRRGRRIATDIETAVEGLLDRIEHRGDRGLPSASC